MLLQKQLQPFFFASICSEWLASVYVSEQLHFRLHNVCCLKGMISVLSRSRDCQTLQCSEFEKREWSIGHCCFFYMFYFCWVTLLVRLSYFSSCYLWLVNLLERLLSLVLWLLSWSFALLDIILLVLKICHGNNCSCIFNISTILNYKTNNK